MTGPSNSPLSDGPLRRRKAREIRLRALYRQFVLKESRRFNPDAMRRLVGPDCAYHLYSRVQGGGG